METAVRLEPLCCARRVTAPQAPLRTAAALPIQVSTGTCNTAVSLHDPSWVRLGSLIMRLTCFRAVELSTPIPQKTDTLRRSLLEKLIVRRREQGEAGSDFKSVRTYHSP